MLTWLEEAEKKELLSNLQEAIDKGEVDEALLPYLGKLNSFPGICTKGSCEGHGRRGEYTPEMIEMEEKNSEVFFSPPPYVIFRLSKQMAEFFREGIIPLLSDVSQVIMEPYSFENEGVKSELSINFKPDMWEKGVSIILEELRKHPN